MKKIFCFVLTFLIFFPIISSFSPLTKALDPVSTEIEKLTNNTEDDFGPSLCVDNLGKPHIAWVRGQASTYDIYYGVKRSSSWDVSKVTSLTSLYQFHISMCLDNDGNPHIAALTQTGRWDLWYMWWDESTADWVVESVANGGTHSHRNVVSLAIDSTGLPHIAWAARWGGGLWGVFYAKKDGELWTIETVSHDDETAPSIALDSSDIPHVLWNHIGYQISPRLRYASRVTGSWTIEEPTGEPGGGDSPRQLFMAPSGVPHIVFDKYVSSGHHELWYGNKSGGSWAFSQIRDPSFTNYLPNIFLNSEGVPYVAWQSNDEGNNDIYLATMEGNDWQVTQVTETLIDEWYSSLFIDSSDNVHIAWYGPGIGSGDSEIYYVLVTSTEEPDFEISVFPDYQIMGLDQSTSFTVTVGSVGGYNSEISLSASIYPAGNQIFLSLDPHRFTLPNGGLVESTLTVTTKSTTTTGTYTITISGSDGEKIHEKTATLAVRDDGFAFSWSDSHKIKNRLMYYVFGVTRPDITSSGLVLYKNVNGMWESFLMLRTDVYSPEEPTGYLHVVVRQLLEAGGEITLYDDKEKGIDIVKEAAKITEKKIREKIEQIGSLYLYEKYGDSMFRSVRKPFINAAQNISPEALEATKLALEAVKAGQEIGTTFYSEQLLIATQNAANAQLVMIYTVSATAIMGVMMITIVSIAPLA